MDGKLGGWREGGRKYSKQQVGNKENMQFGEYPLSFGPDRICRLAVCYSKTQTLKYTELQFHLLIFLNGKRALSYIKT